MLRALWTAATGLDAQQRNVDVIANNLANVNTNGFKRMRADFQDLFYARLREPGAQSATAGNFIPTGIQVGHGVIFAGTPLLFREGTPLPTGMPLDLMIMDKHSFFQIELPNGGYAYTRDGSFHKDAAGGIVTTDGYRLLPAITIPEEAVNVSVSENGTVQAIYSDGSTQDLGQLQLASFPNPAGLRMLGNNLLMETESSGTCTLGFPGQDQYGDIQSGYLEQSNVEAAEELINLIRAQRAFEMNSRVIQTGDEMLQTTAALRR